MQDSSEVVKYYHTFESKLGYRWLNGIKHFGYYPEGQENLSIKAAQLLMNEQLATALSLPLKAVVLDAGCGEGGVAIYLHDNYGLEVKGIDLLDFNIKHAKQNATKNSVDSANFQVASYTKLPFADNSFDGLYTMETLVHAPDYRVALAEFHRVLKPGGKLALFEYSLIEDQSVLRKDPAGVKAIRYINKVSSMPAFNDFNHHGFSAKLTAAGFYDPHEQDITPRMMPMLRYFYSRANRPYKFIKKLHLQTHFVNTMSAIEFYEHPDLWRYNIVTAINR